MVQTDASLGDLLAVRERLVEIIHQGLTDSEKDFFLSFKNHKPDWSLPGPEGISELPKINRFRLARNRTQTTKVTSACL